MSLSKVLKSHHVVISQIPFSFTDLVEPMINEDDQNTDDNENLVQQSIDPRDIEAKLQSKWEEKGQEIIKKANQEADLIKQKALQEAELIKKQAYTLGYEQGSELKLKEIGQCIESVEEACHKMQNCVNKQLRDYENSLHILAIEIASKMLSKTLGSNNLAMLELTKQTVALAKNNPWIEVTLSNKLESSLKVIEKELKQIAPESDVRIQLKDLPISTCIVENSQGVIDASLETQINNLKDLFQQIDPYGEVKKYAK